MIEKNGHGDGHAHLWTGAHDAFRFDPHNSSQRARPTNWFGSAVQYLYANSSSNPCSTANSVALSVDSSRLPSDSVAAEVIVTSSQLTRTWSSDRFCNFH
ncbi:hypothetical protein PM082_005837 [Marasmius tenuissimus]|nr:hypothetical protein PM082_005837 [Marasmius tenuissimus]